jgi:hypothetical protein
VRIGGVLDDVVRAAPTKLDDAVDVARGPHEDVEGELVRYLADNFRKRAEHLRLNADCQSSLRIVVE